MARHTIIHGRIAESGPWVSSTDLMSGLMLIFLFVAIAYMIDASRERDEMHDLAKEWVDKKRQIYEDLQDEFNSDLPQWQAEIDSITLSVRFHEPRVLFAQGDCQITSHFQEILRNFFPRYIRTIRRHENSIAEIRIEGHTSSEWNRQASDDQRYIFNMVLSHNRTKEVLVFCLSQMATQDDFIWAKNMIVAIGASSSRLIEHSGKEDMEASRRVEFRVRTDAEERLTRILESSNYDSTARKLTAGEDSR